MVVVVAGPPGPVAPRGQEGRKRTEKWEEKEDKAVNDDTYVYENGGVGGGWARATHSVVTVMTFTLNAGALNENLLPVEILLVFGVTVSAAPGSLLAVSAPVSWTSVPEPETDENWLRSNVRLSEELPAFAI